MSDGYGYEFAIKDKKIRRIILENLAKETHGNLTICEQIRFVFDTVFLMPDGEIKKDLTEKLIDVFGTAKKMNSRLAHYKRKYKDTTGNAGRNIIYLKHRRARQRMRKERII
jgi:hypothetical protein